MKMVRKYDVFSDDSEFDEEATKILEDIDDYIKKSLSIIRREKNISSYEIAEKLGIDPMLFILYIQDTLVRMYNRKYFTVKEMAFCMHCKKYYDPNIKFCPLCGRKTTRIYIFNAI